MATTEAEFTVGERDGLESQKFLEYFLQGSVFDTSKDELKQRLRALFDNVEPEPFHEHEVSYIIGDKSQISLPTNFTENNSQPTPAKQSKQSSSDQPAPSPIMPAPSPAGSIHSAATPQAPQTPQSINQPASIDKIKPVILRTTKNLEGIKPGVPGSIINNNSSIQTQYCGHIQIRDSKLVNVRPCVISSASEGVFKLITDCWGFNRDYEIVTKGHQFKKRVIHRNSGLQWFIKIRVFKILKITQPLAIDKTEPTQGYMVEASIVTPVAGSKDHITQTSQVLYNFANQLKPFCVLDK